MSVPADEQRLREIEELLAGTRCPNCGRVPASDEDWKTFSEGEGDHLCWGMGANCEQPFDGAPGFDESTMRFLLALLRVREQKLAEANARAARLERVLYPPGDSPQRDDASGEGRGDVGLVVPAESAPTGVPHLDRACELLWQAGHPAIAEALQHEVAAAVREAAGLREAAEAVMVGLRPVRSNGAYVNRFYGPQIERLDNLLRARAVLVSEPAAEETT